MTISEIVEHLNSLGITPQICGDENTEITGFSDPKDYVPGTAIWIGKIEDIVLPDTLSYSDIALCFAKKGSGIENTLPNVLLCEDQKNAFMKMVMLKYGKQPKDNISPTAQISGTAKIGQNCFIAGNVVIEDGVVIGDNCIIRENTYIGENCILGDDCVIGQCCVIGGETNGSFFEDSDGVMKNMPNIGIVRIGRNVQIGAGSLIAKATFSETVIGDECELNAGTSLGHNVKIGKRVQLLGRNTISGNTSIGDYSQLISCCVKNRVVIGQHVKGGIGSVIIKDIPDGSTCIGNPARIMPL